MLPDKKQSEFDHYMSSRAEDEYQKTWRALIKEERQWLPLLKKYDGIFGAMLDIWLTLTETLMNYAHEKHKKIKINSSGSKGN